MCTVFLLHDRWFSPAALCLPSSGVRGGGDFLKGQRTPWTGHRPPGDMSRTGVESGRRLITTGKDPQTLTAGSCTNHSAVSSAFWVNHWIDGDEATCTWAFINFLFPNWAEPSSCRATGGLQLLLLEAPRLCPGPESCLRDPDTRLLPPPGPVLAAGVSRSIPLHCASLTPKLALWTAAAER